jgi:hypothetical protein
MKRIGEIDMELRESGTERETWGVGCARDWWGVMKRIGEIYMEIRESGTERERWAVNSACGQWGCSLNHGDTKNRFLTTNAVALCDRVLRASVVKFI